MDDKRLTEVIVELVMHPQMDTESEGYISDIVEKLGQINVIPFEGTRMICEYCHAINALGYKLKRSGGKYLALCVTEDGGCAGRDLMKSCNFVDHMGISCEELAEFCVTYGKDKLLTTYSCIMHVGIMLKDSENTVYPVK